MEGPIGTAESIEAFRQCVEEKPECLELLSRSIEIALQKNEWPHSFEELIDKVIPKILNHEVTVNLPDELNDPALLNLGHASRAFVGYMRDFSFLSELPNSLEGKNKYLLEVIHTLYSEQFVKLFSFSNNVRAPYKINRYAPYQTNLDLLTIKRVDNVSIDFMLELDQYIGLIQGLLTCYEEAVHANEHSYEKREIERRLLGIERIRKEFPEMLGRG
ncbi:hypothetical protein [Bacillus toyonensis]